MKVAVTGASGFLGGRIVAELSGRGIAVLAISRRAFVAPAGVTTHLCSEYDDLPGADVLVHLAEESSMQSVAEMGEEHIERNVARIRRMRDCGRFGRVVYGSSAAVYGDDSPRPRRPGDALVSKTIYARAKLACESVVLGAHGVALRFGNIIGPGMSGASVLSQIVAQIPGDGDLHVRDDSAVRDFLWNGDMAECVAAFVTSPATGVFNVGSGEACSVRRLGEVALEVAGETHRKIVSETRAPRLSQLVLDISDTCAAVGWQPRIRLDAAVARILESAHD